MSSVLRSIDTERLYGGMSRKVIRSERDDVDGLQIINGAARLRNVYLAH